MGSNPIVSTSHETDCPHPLGARPRRAHGSKYQGGVSGGNTAHSGWLAAGRPRYVMGRIWIAGEGVVGRRVARFLADRSIGRVDPRDPGDLNALREGDALVIASGGQHAPLAAEVITRGASVITVGDDLEDCRQLLVLEEHALSRHVSLVVGAALSPGLSGLIVRSLLPKLASCTEVHIAMHGTAGPGCARAYHRSLSGWSPIWRDGEMVSTPGGAGRELLWFPEPVGPQDCYLAEIASPLLLHRSLPDVRRISVRRSARRRDRVTARLPMMRAPHSEGGIGALRVELRGVDLRGERVSLVRGVAEQVGTASAAVASVFAEAVVDGLLGPGLTLAGDPVVAQQHLLRRVVARGIRLQEYSGSAEG